jgi:hypothetical protein
MRLLDFHNFAFQIPQTISRRLSLSGVDQRLTGDCDSLFNHRTACETLFHPQTAVLAAYLMVAWLEDDQQKHFIAYYALLRLVRDW